MTKKRSILAELLFCVLVFLACNDTDSIPVVIGGSEPETSPEETAATDSAATDSVTTDSTAGDSSRLHFVLGENEITSSNLYLSYPADSFLTKFEIGDIITVTIVGYDTLDIPVVESSNDAPIAGISLKAVSGSKELALTIHNGRLAEILGITVEKAPIDVYISMKEKGGFLFGLEMRYFQYMDYYTVNYPDLSIEEFANFREVRTTGMGKNKLYRSSSPVDLCLGRNFYADSLAKEAGVATFINLADTEDNARTFKSFDSSYYSTQDVIFLALPVEFFSKPFKEGLAKGFRFMIEHDAPYLVHCTYGMDRTGFTIAVLEALMGATSDDIKKDYAKTFTNYFNVVDGRQVALNEEQAGFFEAVVLKNLKAVYHAEGIEIPDASNADWAPATEKYLEKLGMTPKEISDLKDKLK
ncbi:MAG: tyrosine-protein phosphatase [Fibrobacter sp.]|uniref:tyrosine-protein phosphatase n=1 Tax=Fibrobacter sp. TaxID=35828 RepID=UPI0025BA35C6|nr:tyrosine-protein phosphatase [Fibrobacter sp.]MBR4784245.1 tyrosine-protein phosphatase [Fibrobacter sp.]